MATLSAEDVDALVGELGTLRRRLTEAEGFITQLLLRVKVLEDRPLGVHWVGVWDASRAYVRDDAVTSSGSLWVAVDSSRGRKPGQHPQVWRLAVQRGRDGRDANGSRAARAAGKANEQ